mgnify:CR=1 FL=1
MRDYIFILLLLAIAGNINAQWAQMNGPVSGSFNNIQVSGTNIWLSGQAGGIFFSSNQGNTWIGKGFSMRRVNFVFLNGNSIFAATDIGVYKSTNNGNNWNATTLTSQNILPFIVSAGIIFAGDAAGKGIFRSSNDGLSWDTVNNGLGNKYVYSMISNNNNIYAGTVGGVYVSSNSGLNWVNMNNTRRIDAMTIKDSIIFAGGLGTGFGIWKTTNNGLNWNRTDNGISQPNIYTLYTNGNYILAGTATQSLFKSTDNGLNWFPISVGIKSNQIISVTAVDSNIYTSAGGSTGLFISTNNGNSFQGSNTYGAIVMFFGIRNDKIFSMCQQSGIYMSSNNGLDWAFRSLKDSIVSAFITFNSEIYVGIGTYGCFKSVNDCQSWTQTGLMNKGIYSLNSVQSKLFAGVTNEGLYVTSNGGTNWTKMQNEISSYSVAELCEIGSELFSGTKSNGLFKSTNNGLNWIAINNGLPSPNKYTFRLFALDTILIAQMADVLENSRIYKSTDKGNNWIEINPAFWGWFRKMEYDNNNFYMPTYEGIFVSTNKGISWTPKNEGLYNLYLNSVISVNNYLLAGTGGNSVWRRPIQELIGITNISTEVPSGFVLEQNYPNPFNPVTNIKFQVASSKFIKLVVYDLLGREVRTLVNEALQAGTYQVRFDAGDLPGGIYFYQLRTDNFSETKKLIILK